MKRPATYRKTKQVRLSNQERRTLAKERKWRNWLIQPTTSISSNDILDTTKFTQAPPPEAILPPNINWTEDMTCNWCMIHVEKLDNHLFHCINCGRVYASLPL